MHVHTYVSTNVRIRFTQYRYLMSSNWQNETAMYKTNALQVTLCASLSFSCNKSSSSHKVQPYVRSLPSCITHSHVVVRNVGELRLNLHRFYRCADTHTAILKHIHAYKLYGDRFILHSKGTFYTNYSNFVCAGPVCLWLTNLVLIFFFVYFCLITFIYSQTYVCIYTHIYI